MRTYSLGLGFRRALATSTLSITVLLACGGSNDPANLVSTQVCEAGGQLSSHDGVLTVSLLPNALSECITLEIYPSETPPATFGSAYRVRPDVDVTVPVEVTYRADLPADPDTAGVASIHREDFQTTGGYWRTLTRTDFNALEGIVAGMDTEIGLFYALVDTADNGTTSDVEPTTGTTDSTTGESSDSSSGTSEGGADTQIPVYSHAVDIQPIWEQSCTDANCHDGGNPSAGIDLLNGAYEALLTEDPASGASIPYVTPGSSAESYLMHKLDGTATLQPSKGGCDCNGSGGTMPLGQERLDIETRNIIRAWINQGAPQ